MSKRGIVLLIILVIVAALGIIVYQTVKGGIEIDRVEVGVDIESKNKMIVDLDVFLDSPFFWDTEIKRLDYKAQLANETLVDGSEVYDSLYLTPSLSKIPLQVQVDPQQIKNTINKIQDQDSTQLVVDYGLIYRVPVFGTGDIEKKMTKQIPVPVPPEFILEDISFDNLVLGDSTIATINLTVINHGFVEFTINSMDYRLMVEGDEWAKGSRNEELVLKSKATNNYTLEIELDPQNLEDRLWQRFIDGEPVNYGVYINADVDIPVDLIDLQHLKIYLENSY